MRHICEFICDLNVGSRRKKNSESRIYNKGLHPAFAMFTTLPNGLSQALPAFEENLTPHEEDIDIPPSQIQRGNAWSQDPWPTQGSTQEIPAELDEDFNFAFKCSEAARTGMAPDPTERCIREIVEASTEAELNKAMWATDIFQDCGNEKQLVEFIKKNLTSFQESEKTHREIAMQHAPLTLLAPKPVVQAVHSFCVKNGLHKESFLAFIESNINWLEHNRSRLGAEIPPEGMKREDILDEDDGKSEAEEEKSCMERQSHLFAHKKNLLSVSFHRHQIAQHQCAHS